MISRETVVATVAVKWLIETIERFDGPSSELKSYLLRILREKEREGDERLAESFSSLLGP